MLLKATFLLVEQLVIFSVCLFRGFSLASTTTTQNNGSQPVTKTTKKNLQLSLLRAEADTTHHQKLIIELLQDFPTCDMAKQKQYRGDEWQKNRMTFHVVQSFSWHFSPLTGLLFLRCHAKLYKHHFPAKWIRLSCHHTRTVSLSINLRFLWVQCWTLYARPLDRQNKRNYFWFNASLHNRLWSHS